MDLEPDFPQRSHHAPVLCSLCRRWAFSLLIPQRVLSSPALSRWSFGMCTQFSPGFSGPCPVLWLPALPEWQLLCSQGTHRAPRWHLLVTHGSDGRHGDQEGFDLRVLVGEVISGCFLGRRQDQRLRVCSLLCLCRDALLTHSEAAGVAQSVTPACIW